MDELITELKRIADALEAQNRIYVERCKESDTHALAYEQRLVAHDLALVEKQHAARTTELEREYRNLLLVQQLYAAEQSLQTGKVEDEHTTQTQT